MRKIKSTRQAQRFVTARAAVSNLFNLGRHLIRAEHYRVLRVSVFEDWSRAVAFEQVEDFYDLSELIWQNPLKRYRIGSADNLKTNADGSTTIYLQAKSPGKNKESNWLPTPAAPFYIC